MEAKVVTKEVDSNFKHVDIVFTCLDEGKIKFKSMKKMKISHKCNVNDESFYTFIKKHG